MILLHYYFKTRFNYFYPVQNVPLPHINVECWKKKKESKFSPRNLNPLNYFLLILSPWWQSHLDLHLSCWDGWDCRQFWWYYWALLPSETPAQISSKCSHKSLMMKSVTFWPTWNLPPTMQDFAMTQKPYQIFVTSSLIGLINETMSMIGLVSLWLILQPWNINTWNQTWCHQVDIVEQYILQHKILLKKNYKVLEKVNKNQESTQYGISVTNYYYWVLKNNLQWIEIIFFFK